MSKKRAFAILLAIILSAPVLNIYSQARWMTDNAAIIEKKQLNQIALPGAHDAETFGITLSKNSGIGLSDGLSSPDNKQIKRILSLGPVFGDWSKTQERTTAEMLNDGIRYFDIRVCVDSKGILMTCH